MGPVTDSLFKFMNHPNPIVDPVTEWLKVVSKVLKPTENQLHLIRKNPSNIHEIDSIDIIIKEARFIKTDTHFGSLTEGL